jgi:hypothetical protein
VNSVQVRLYDLFRKELNLPDEKAVAFVSAVEEAVEQEFNNEKQSLSAKQAILVVQQDVALSGKIYMHLN